MGPAWCFNFISAVLLAVSFTLCCLRPQTHLTCLHCHIHLHSFPLDPLAQIMTFFLTSSYLLPPPCLFLTMHPSPLYCLSQVNSTVSGLMMSWYQPNGLWRLVSGSDKKLIGKPKVLDSKGNVVTCCCAPRWGQTWEMGKSKLVYGALKTAISHELIRDCEDDPILIWDTLKASFVVQRTVPCFNIYHTLLST